MARRLLPGGRPHCHGVAGALAVRSRRGGSMADRACAGRGGQWRLRPLLHAVRGSVYAHPGYRGSPARRSSHARVVRRRMRGRAQPPRVWHAARARAGGRLALRRIRRRAPLVRVAVVGHDRGTRGGAHSSTVASVHRVELRERNVGTLVQWTPGHHQHGTASCGFCHACGDRFRHCRGRHCRRSELSDDPGGQSVHHRSRRRGGRSSPTVWWRRSSSSG